MNANAQKEEYEHVKIFGYPALLTTSRIDRATVPEGWHCYDLRGSDYDPEKPIMVEDNIVVVNHAGTVLLPHDLNLDKIEGHRMRIENHLEYLDEMLTYQSFCEEYSISREENDNSGKDIKILCGSRRLKPEDISFGGEIVEMMDGTLNFYLESVFNVDEVFGTNICTDENDDTMNIYADYHRNRNQISDALSITLWHGNSCKNCAYPLSSEEKAILLSKMEDYSREQTGFCLREYSSMLECSEQKAPRSNTELKQKRKQNTR